MSANLDRVEDLLIQRAVKIGTLFTERPINIYKLKIEIAAMRLELENIEKHILADEVIESLPVGFNSGRKK